MSAAQNRKADASAALRQERLFFDSFRYAFCKISAIGSSRQGILAAFACPEPREAAFIRRSAA